MTSNNIENHKVIYIDTTGHRIQDPARGGQYRQQNISYTLPQRVFGPGALDNNRPGPSRSSVPWPQGPSEPVYDQPQPAGHQEEEEPPRSFYPDQHQVYDNIPQQRFVLRSMLVQEAPDEQRCHYPAPNFT